MSFKYRLPSQAKIPADALVAEYRKLRRDLATEGNQDTRNLMAKAYALFRDFMETLGKPTFQFQEIDPTRAPSLEYWNNTRESIEDDLRGAKSELNALSKASIGTFNVAQIMAKELEGSVAKAAGKAQDLAILKGIAEPDVLIAGDDFNDILGVNLAYPRVSALASVNTNQGIVTLAREESEPIVDPESVGIDVVAVTPPGAPTGPTNENIGRVYEGKFYALAGEAEPEGNNWHLEEQPNYDPEGYSSTIRKQEFSDGKKIKDKEKVTHGDAELGLSGPSNSLEEGGLLIRDRGATESEKKTVRKGMVDGNSDTYWQVEYIVKPDFGTALPRGIPFFHSGLPGNEPVELDLRLEKGVVPESESEIPLDQRDEVTPEDLRYNATLFDSIDFEIQITITIPTPKIINYITLNPMNFGETTWLNVTDVQTAPERNAEMVRIPGLTRNVFANTLTADVNAEVSSSISNYTLSPSRYHYRGVGVWTFPARQAQVIQIRVKQSTPIPILYQRLHVQMRRIVDKHNVETYRSENKNYRTITDKHKEWTRIVALDYLQSVRIFTGESSASGNVETTQASQRSGGTSETWDDVGAWNSFWGGSNVRSASNTQNKIDTGWYINAYWAQTYYDLIGYRIGIRDIGVYKFRYAQISELVSRTWISPKPISRVALEVDAVVPDGTDILYYVSHDKGQTWDRINPKGSPSIYDASGQAVPRIIVFNEPGSAPNEQKYITTTDPVRHLLLKAEFKTNDVEITPTLKSYRLLIFPENGLRREDVLV